MLTDNNVALVLAVLVSAAAILIGLLSLLGRGENAPPMWTFWFSAVVASTLWFFWYAL